MIDKDNLAGLARGLETMHRRARLAAEVVEVSEGTLTLEAAGARIARHELTAIRLHLREWLTFLDHLELGE